MSKYRFYAQRIAINGGYDNSADILACDPPTRTWKIEINEFKCPEHNNIINPQKEERCDRCGATWNGKSWEWKCKKCEKKVAPGKLVVLFVPHVCKECETKVAEQQKRIGHVCSLCGHPYSRCCC